MVIDEVMNENFFGCEFLYMIVIWMFEVVLDNDDEFVGKRLLVGKEMVMDDIKE